MRSLGETPTDADVAIMVKDVDTDGSGAIDFDEFTQMMAGLIKTSNDEEELKAAFRVFDKDGSGTIDDTELRGILTSLGEPLTRAECDELFAEADKDGDGSINYIEFVKVLMSR